MTLIERARTVANNPDALSDENALPETLSELARFAVAVSVSLPRLRREHHKDDRRPCLADAARLSQRCDCGASEHNATIDRLLAMLEAP